MALSDERIAELKEVALKIAPLHRSAARPFARSIEAEVRKEYEARIAELEAQLESIGAGGVSRLVAPAPAAQPTIYIDFKQATELLAMFGGESAEIALVNGGGHSGDGLYAYYTADPDGAEFLGQTEEDAAPQPPQAQAEHARDAAHYRFIINQRLILAGAAHLGWVTAPFGEACHAKIAAAIAAQEAKGE